MRVNLLSKRYAQAVFDLSIETNITDKIAKDLALIKEVLEENRQLRKIMGNPVLDDTKKATLLVTIFGKHVEELTAHFLHLITRKGRASYLLSICIAFNEIYKNYKNILSAELVTAIKADVQIRKSVISKLTNLSDKTIELNETIDEDIMGGFVIKFEDYQYDASVANQLRRLKKEFSDNLYVKQF